MELIVGQQRSISEHVKTSGRGRVAEDKTDEDATADDVAQFRQVDLAWFATMGIGRPGAVGITDQLPNHQPVGIVIPGQDSSTLADLADEVAAVRIIASKQAFKRDDVVQDGIGVLLRKHLPFAVRAGIEAPGIGDEKNEGSSEV